MMLNRLLSAIWLLTGAFLWCSASFAQVPNQGIAVPNTAPGSISDTATAGDLLAANSTGQAADSSVACATNKYCTLPVGLNITDTVNFGAGSASGAQNAMIWANATYAGTCTSNPCAFNQFSFGDGAVSAGNVYGFLFNSTVNNSAASGNRILGMFQLSIASAPSDVGANYSSLQTITQSSVSFGGTSGAGNGRGAVFGFNPYARLASGATNISQLVGTEIDVSVRTGANVDQVVGLQIVQDSLDVISGQQIDIAISANGQAVTASSAGWDVLLSDGAYAGYPSIKSTGSVFRCTPHTNTGTCGAIGYGLDLANYTSVANYVLRGPASNGYIDGSFNVNAYTVAVTGATVPALGMLSPAAGVGGLSATSNVVLTWGVASTLGWVTIGNNFTSPLTATDVFIIRESQTGAVGATFKNVNSGSAAQIYLNFANSTSNTETQFTLNGGAFSGGHGANAFTITSAGSFYITGGTHDAIMVDTNGYVYGPSLATATAAQTAYACLGAGGKFVSVAVANSCATSSEQFKEDIAPLDLGLDAVMALHAIRYHYKLTGDDKFDYAPGQRSWQLGFSAEQAARVDDRLIGVDSNGKPRSFRYEQYVAVLTRAIQEQQAKIDALEAQLRSR